jgi:hypothetical protein
VKFGLKMGRGGAALGTASVAGAVAAALFPFRELREASVGKGAEKTSPLLSLPACEYESCEGFACSPVVWDVSSSLTANSSDASSTAESFSGSSALSPSAVA